MSAKQKWTLYCKIYYSGEIRKRERDKYLNAWHSLKDFLKYESILSGTVQTPKANNHGL